MAVGEAVLALAALAFATWAARWRPPVRVASPALKPLAKALSLYDRHGVWRGPYQAYRFVLAETMEHRVALRLHCADVRWGLIASKATVGRTGDPAFDEWFTVDWHLTGAEVVGRRVRAALLAARRCAYVQSEDGYIELVWAARPTPDAVVAGADALCAIADAVRTRPPRRQVAFDDEEPAPLRARAALQGEHGEALAPLLVDGHIDEAQLDLAFVCMSDGDTGRAVAGLLQGPRSVRWQWALRATQGRSTLALATAWVAWWPRGTPPDHHAAARLVAQLLVRHRTPGDVPVLADTLRYDLPRTLRNTVLQRLQVRATLADVPALEAARDALPSVADTLTDIIRARYRAAGAVEGGLSLAVPGEQGRLSLGDDTGGGLSEP